MRIVEGGLCMSWQDILKANSMIDKLNSKDKKRVKKLLQKTQPTQYFGQDMTQLGDLISMMETLDVVKDDSKLSKKMKTFGEQNLDILASAAELRKDYETLYYQLRKVVYPKSKKEEKE